MFEKIMKKWGYEYCDGCKKYHKFYKTNWYYRGEKCYCFKYVRKNEKGEK